MKHGVHPYGEPQPAHGTEPMPRSGGADPTLSEMMSLLLRQMDMMDSLFAQQSDLIAALMSEDEQDDDGEGTGRDMAGKPIRVG